MLGMSEINNDTLIEKTQKKIIAFLLKKSNVFYHNLNNKSNNIESKYQFLTPNDEAEHIEEYSIALEEALRNKLLFNFNNYGKYKLSFYFNSSFNCRFNFWKIRQTCG